MSRLCWPAVCFLILGFCWVTVTATTTERSFNEWRRRCSPFEGEGVYVAHNYTTGKCALGFGAPCSDSWNPDVYQCAMDGSGKCVDGTCGCDEQKALAQSGSMTTNNRKFKYYSCLPQGDFGESCDYWARNGCSGHLDCDGVSELCVCRGRWNETERICYNDKYCAWKAEVGAEYGQVFFDIEADVCKCHVGTPCAQSVRLCPANASLNHDLSTGNSTCLCNPGFTPIANRRVCVPARRRGESCETDADADGGLNLKMRMNFTAEDEVEELWLVGDCADGSLCLNNTCVCHRIEGRWDLSGPEPHCFGRVGARCGLYYFWGPLTQLSTQCTPNAVCMGVGERDRYGDSQCKCLPPYKTYPDGQCGLPYGETCSGACVEGMSCVDGRCRCRDAVGQYYDVGSRRCMTLIGGSCNDTDSCVKTAYCNVDTGKCDCDSAKGLTPNQVGSGCYAKLGYDAPCNATVTATTAAWCDPAKGLACLQEAGKCECVDRGMKYDPRTGVEACLGPEGFGCGRIKIPGTCIPGLPPFDGQPDACEFITVACEQGARCINSDGADDKTICMGDSVADADTFV